MPCGRKRKRHKIATHKRKKRLRKNRHKKKKVLKPPFGAVFCARAGFASHGHLGPDRRGSRYLY